MEQKGCGGGPSSRLKSYIIKKDLRVCYYVYIEMPYKDPIKRAEFKKQYWLDNKERYDKARREYQLKNKDRLNKKSKEYRLKNIDVIKVKGKEYREKNKDKYKEYGRAYYLKNKDSLRKKAKEYYLKNHDSVLMNQRKYHLKNNQVRISSNTFAIDRIFISKHMHQYFSQMKVKEKEERYRAKKEIQEELLVSRKIN